MQKSVIAILLLSSAAAFANEASDEMANRTSSIGERTRATTRAEVRQLGGPGTRSVSELDRIKHTPPEASAAAVLKCASKRQKPLACT
jgi:hypothetical protein